MEGCTWRTDGDVTYLHVDFRFGDETALMERLHAVERAVAEAGPGCRMLVEVEGFTPSRAFLAEAKAVNKRTLGPVRCRVAALGVSPTMGMMIRGWSAVGGGVRAQACPHRDSALRFLAQGGD